MSLSCIITVPAGQGNGAPREPMVDNVSRFIKDSDHYYRAVHKHLKSCKDCDPAEALTGYLRNRDGNKQFGRTSGGLVKLAYRYKRDFGDRVPDGVPAEFLERSLASNWPGFMFLASKREDIGMPNVMRAIGFEEKAWREEVLDSVKTLKKAASALMKGEKNRAFPTLDRVSPQPFYNLCFQLLRGDARERTAENAELYDAAKKAILEFSGRDFSLDEDPAVRKAVKLMRILKGGLRDGTVLPLLSAEKAVDIPLTDSGYADDEDEDVRSLARSAIVLSVMEG